MIDPLQHDVDQARQRAARYWVQDGLNEIVVGLLLLVVGAYLLVEGTAPLGPAMNTPLLVGFAILVIALSLLARSLVLRLKDRYVHARTGYVAFRQEKSPAARWFAGGLAAAIGGVVAIVAGRPPLLAWLPALQGIFFGAVFLFAWRKLQLARFTVEGLLCTVAGFGIAWLHLNENLATGLLFGWAGLLLGAGGAVAFRAYLAAAPLREDQ